MVRKDKIKILDSERMFGTAFKNSSVDTVILLTKKKICNNGQKGEVSNIEKIKYELSVQLHYEQYCVERERKLPIYYLNNFRVILEILSHVVEMKGMTFKIFCLIIHNPLILYRKMHFLCVIITNMFWFFCVC